MTVEIVKWQRQDDDILRGIVELRLQERLESDPELDPGNREEMMRAQLMPDCSFHVSTYLARIGEKPVGYATYSWAKGTTEDEKVGNDDALWLEVYVDQKHRRQGIGTALFERLLQDSPDERERIWMETFGRGEYDANAAGIKFCEKHGLKIADVERCSRLNLPVDDEILDRFDPTQNGSIGEYRIETFINGIAAELLPSALEIFGAVEAEAPTGEREVEPVKQSESQYFEDLKQNEAIGHNVIEVLAVHEPTREVAGFSALFVPKNPGRPTGVTGTLVRKEHRGHKLGMAMKVAVLRAVKQYPHKYMDTENSGQNQHMLDINVALGFYPYGYLVEMQGTRKK